MDSWDRCSIWAKIEHMHDDNHFKLLLFGIEGKNWLDRCVILGSSNVTWSRGPSHGPWPWARWVGSGSLLEEALVLLLLAVDWERGDPTETEETSKSDSTTDWLKNERISSSHVLFWVGSGQITPFLLIIHFSNYPGQSPVQPGRGFAYGINYKLKVTVGDSQGIWLLVYTQTVGNFSYVCVDRYMMRLEMERNRKKKERHPRQWKNENESPQVGFKPTTLCTLDRCSYQLSCQGSPAGRVQI